jgi:hypothetical protein
MPRGERLFKMSLNIFKKEIETLSNEELLNRFVASQIEESKNFLKSEWQKENRPFVDLIKSEVLKRMGN